MVKTHVQSKQYNLERINYSTATITFKQVVISKDLLTEILNNNTLSNVKFIIVYIPLMTSIDRESQLYTTEIAKGLAITHIAVLTNHFLQNLGVKVYSKLFNPPFNIKVFKEESDALNWFKRIEIA